MDPHTVQLLVGDDPPTAKLYYGRDVREVLSSMPSGSVHTVVTSPPYYNLRNYGTPPLVFGGRKGCGHQWDNKGLCVCGAWEGELGGEPTPEMYVEHMVEVFQEVHRVLRDDGTLWLNMGDTYWGGGSTTSRSQEPGPYAAKSTLGSPNRGGKGRPVKPQRHNTLKPKDLVGIPWRLALALQDDGWWLRNDIIWTKKNGLPHPVKDRLTSSHEHIFLLTKSRRYFFNLDAIRAPHTYGNYDDEGGFTPAQQWLSEDPGRTDRKLDQTESQLGTHAGPPRRLGRGLYNRKGKNPGDSWVFPTQPFPGLHFAVFPSALPERCILAGTSDKGVCPSCSTPWHLVKEYGDREDLGASSGIAPELGSKGTRAKDPSGKGGNVQAARPVLSEEWKPACDCGSDVAVRSTVLDPFSGSGTTGMVALELGHDYIGIDLNDDYLKMASSRVIGEKLPEEPSPIEEGSVLDLFGGGT